MDTNVAWVGASLAIAPSPPPLTELQAAVLAIIGSAAQPAGAYDILNTLNELSGRQVKPPTIYRILNVLVGRAMVWRVGTQNTYVLRKTSASHSRPLLFICTSCGQTDEVWDRWVMEALERRAREAGFHASENALEAEGLCRGCFSKSGQMNER